MIFKSYEDAFNMILDMKNNKYLCILTIILVTISLTSCFSKKYARVAKKYEDAALYQLAVDNYITSLEKKDKNNDVARIGLMRASQRYLNELEYKINDAYNALQDDQVVDYFVVYQNLKGKAALYQVDIDINQKAQGQFNESKTRYLRAAYTKAQELLDRESFYQAELELIEILKLDPTYERTKELYLYARSEPLYREANNYMDTKRYRSAYNAFTRLKNIDSNYKDVLDLRSEALQNALLTIAIQPATNASTYPYLATQITETTKAQFVKANNPFLKIVATDHLQQMLAEQRKALANNLPFDATMLIPVRVFLNGNILLSQYQLSKVESKQRSAYLKYEDKKTRKTAYKKVNYSECTRSVRASIQYRFEFVRVESGTIIANGNLSKTYSDNVQYAVSDYAVSDLYPFDSRSGKSDTIYTNYSKVDAFRAQFSASSKLAEKAYFEKTFATYAASEIYKKMSEYDPEK